VGLGVAVGFAMMIIIQGGMFYWFLGKWFLNPNEPEPLPVHYLQLVNFSFGGMLATGLIITTLFAEYDPEKTALMSWYGYNNICKVFDFYPANFIMPAWFNIISMIACQFAIKDTKRLMRSRLSTGMKNFGRILNISFVCAIVAFATCLAIGPSVNMYMHSIPFLMIICIWPLIFIVHLLETPQEERTTFVVVGVVLLAILSWTKGSCTLIALVHQHINATVGQVLDQLWTVVFVFSPCCLFLPYHTSGNSMVEEVEVQLLLEKGSGLK